jgi:hypothetical protein
MSHDAARIHASMSALLVQTFSAGNNKGSGRRPLPSKLRLVSGAPAFV